MKILLDRSNKQYLPGDSIRGSVQWDELPSETIRLEVRLIWFTTGKGTRDVETVDQAEIVSPPPSGKHNFQFVAPHRPSSFSGTLITLSWAIEVIEFPAIEAEQETIVITGNGREIELEAVKEEKRKRIFKITRNR